VELFDNMVRMVRMVRQRVRRSSRSRISRGVVLGLMAGALLIAGDIEVRADAASNSSTSAESTGSSAQSAPPPGLGSTSVDLDRLLKLPSSYNQPTANRAGADKAEWQSRFGRVQGDLDEAKGALAQAQEDLGKTASETGSYSVAAPGTTPNPENTPLSYKLRQEIRRQRERVDDAEHQLRLLQVQADLAGVPPNWRSQSEGAVEPD
jgi:hypothetical protein